MTPHISDRRLTQIRLQIPRWRIKWRPCNAMAVSQAFIFHFNNLNQSAYTKYYSTETTLLSLHDDLITAISHQQVCCLCLLDLSAAFDNSPPSSLILVRYCRLCPDMVQNVLNISLFLCSCLWFRITSLSPFMWRTPRLCPWPYPFQHVHHTCQHSHLIPVIKSSYMLMSLK